MNIQKIKDKNIKLNTYVYILAIYILTAGLTKIVNSKEAYIIVVNHNILNPQYIGIMIMSHAIISIIISVLLIIKKEIIKIIFTIYLIISTSYLIAIIIKNGWNIDCGCMPGIMEHDSMTIPVIREAIVIYMYVEIYYNKRKTIPVDKK